MTAPSDDMVLRIRISQLTTSHYDLTGELPLVVQLSGQVAGPVDNLLPILRALKLGRPMVQVTLIADDDIPTDEPQARPVPDTEWHDGLDHA